MIIEGTISFDSTILQPARIIVQHKLLMLNSICRLRRRMFKLVHENSDVVFDVVKLRQQAERLRSIAGQIAEPEARSRAEVTADSLLRLADKLERERDRSW